MKSLFFAGLLFLSTGIFAQDHFEFPRSEIYLVDTIQLSGHIFGFIDRNGNLIEVFTSEYTEGEKLPKEPEELLSSGGFLYFFPSLYSGMIFRSSKFKSKYELSWRFSAKVSESEKYRNHGHLKYKAKVHGLFALGIIKGRGLEIGFSHFYKFKKPMENFLLVITSVKRRL
ncbi:hypothetical protein [Pontibacter sp. G13]|uniref:hypothetical protein n=1 Tax=Pontibacter sp. G13 TaxID=3074898 RepID=UPI00288BA2B9|nr:hypothetical protein [Pontibacter sp. G13]WNJ19621.1 hypothetical protein RJD25_03970 [Pontibacter sp. G13]